jgi:hypothetical protein
MVFMVMYTILSNKHSFMDMLLASPAIEDVFCDTAESCTGTDMTALTALFTDPKSPAAFNKQSTKASAGFGFRKKADGAMVNTSKMADIYFFRPNFI